MTNENTTTPSPAKLLVELNALVADVDKMMTGSFTGHSAQAYEGVRERCAAIRTSLGEAYGDARDTLAAGAKDADRAIRANPYQSIAIAAGVGLLVGGLIGVILARRDA